MSKARNHGMIWGLSQIAEKFSFKTLITIQILSQNDLPIYVFALRNKAVVCKPFLGLIFFTELDLEAGPTKRPGSLDCLADQLYAQPLLSFLWHNIKHPNLPVIVHLEQGRWRFFSVKSK